MSEHRQDRRSRHEYGVSPEEFVRTWQTSETTQEAADKLKMPKDIVLARVSAYRKAGVNLKKMRRVTTRSVDVARLNKLIEDLRSQGPRAGGEPGS
jgi:hypothetical protein